MKPFTDEDKIRLLEDATAGGSQSNSLYLKKDRIEALLHRLEAAEKYIEHLQSISQDECGPLCEQYDDWASSLGGVR